MKEFKTIEQQIEILKTKGLTFNDEENAKEILLNNNYYNIINGYKDLFIAPDTDDKFIEGTSFEEIYALYEFDRHLRTIFLESILKIENSMRTLVAYHFSEVHGADNYLKLANFELFQDTNVSDEKKQNQIRYIQNTIGNINKKIANNISNTKYINHYMIQYGYIPLWVLVNILSFGDISTFYKLMKQKERVTVSKNFNIMEYDLTSLLGILCHTRNLCAHDERLYNFKFHSNESINDSIYHSQLNISKDKERYICGKNDLFAVVIALKLLLNQNDYQKFHSKLFSRIMSIQSKLKTITLKQLLDSMNFPNNWHDISKMS